MKKDLFKFSKFLNLNFDGPQQIVIVWSNSGLMDYSTPPWPDYRSSYAHSAVIELIKEITHIQTIKNVKMDLAITVEGDSDYPLYDEYIYISDYTSNDLNTILDVVEDIYTWDNIGVNGWTRARGWFAGTIHTAPEYQRTLIYIGDGDGAATQEIRDGLISAMSDITNSTGTFATYPVEIHAALVPYYTIPPNWWGDDFYVSDIVNVLPIHHLDYTVEHDFVNFAVERLRGIIERYYFTSADNDEVYGDDTYLSTCLGRSGIDYRTELEKNNIKITFPLANNFARAWIDEQYEYFLEMELIELKDSVASILWKGSLSSVNVSQKTITLIFDSVMTGMARNGLTRMYQRTCPYKLYGGQCKLYKSDFLNVGTISAISGKTVTVTEAASKSDGYYTHGIIEDKEGNRRFITKHVGNQLTLSKWSRGFQTEFDSSGYVDVYIYPGCDKSVETCSVKFSNVGNFGGMPYMKVRDIFNNGLTFS